MNVGNLRQLLEGYDDEQEVVLAFQPSWPLAFQLGNVVADSERDVHDDSDPEDEGEEQDDRLWLVAGDSARPNPYAPRDVFERY